MIALAREHLELLRRREARAQERLAREQDRENIQDQAEKQAKEQEQAVRGPTPPLRQDELTDLDIHLPHVGMQRFQERNMSAYWRGVLAESRYWAAYWEGCHAGENPHYQANATQPQQDKVRAAIRAALSACAGELPPEYPNQDAHLHARIDPATQAILNDPDYRHEYGDDDDGDDDNDPDPGAGDPADPAHPDIHLPLHPAGP